MADHPSGLNERTTHWQHIYEATDIDAVSWYQSEPAMSLELIDLLGAGPATGIIDVGGGASTLVDRLLARGSNDLTVLDISPAALRASRQRIGDDGPVTWLAKDVLTWEPSRTYELWHDRAVFHFMAGREIDDYRRTLGRALSPGGAIIMATFAPNGPERCSGLPVTRYSSIELETTLGTGFEVFAERQEVHTTPNGGSQPFTWIAARRTST